MAAAARAIATREDCSLIDDPFAEPLVRAVGTTSSPGWRPANRPPTNWSPQVAIDVAKIRNKFYDEFFRISERWREHGFDTDMARLRHFGERNEAAPYLADRGWAVNGTRIRDLLTADDLPLLEDDALRMGDTLYVSCDF